MRKPLISIFTTVLLVLPSVSCAQQGTRHATPEPQQQAKFTVVDNAGGGQVVYGALPGHSTLSGGMVEMLRQVHARFGEKPQIGKLFQARDGSALATFFTLSAKNDGGKQVTGLVIVAMRKDESAEGAALYDNAEKFLQSEPSLAQALTTAWAGGSGEKTTESPEQKAILAQLHEVTGGDKSAFVSLPTDWRVTSVNMGQLTAEGPHDEQLALDLFIQNIAESVKYKMTGNPLQIVCPLKADLFTDFVCVFNQARKNSSKNEAIFQLISQQQLAPDFGTVRPIQVIFTLDENDGVGPRKGSARIGAFKSPGMHTWLMTVSTSNIPVKYADDENALLMAIIKSYRMDNKVITAESGTVIDRIRQDDNQKRRDADDRWMRRSEDTSGLSSKVLQYFMLDAAMPRDTEGACDRYADALVKAHPEVFELVPNQQMVLDADY